MRIAILGGGPAGLYFAILAKREWPGHQLTVYERNQADDTFGFGVVFSDQTLETFERYDAPSHAAIVQSFAYRQDVEVRFKGITHRIGGNGLCGCARRTPLRLLQDIARALGVAMEFRREIADIAQFDADLIVAADGINSMVRAQFAQHLQPTVDMRPSKFAWMGSTKPLDAFTFSQTEWGIVVAHAYQYEPGRSIWRILPMIHTARYAMGNVVLLADATATAHVSIGSGTKLATEDAIALCESMRPHADVPGALAAFDTNRREEPDDLLRKARPKPVTVPARQNAT